MKRAWLVTCEHGGNVVPPKYGQAFVEAQEALESHRGYDAGALPLARALADQLHAPLYFSETTRLLIDLNRSLTNPEVWSDFSKELPVETLTREYYLPYRNQVEKAVKSLILEGSQVVHLSIHSFTPVWHGSERKTDIGLLFDDERVEELNFAMSWKATLSTCLPGYQIDFNRPYLGKDDGFTTHLRTLFDPDHYLGIELEINQRFAASIDRFFDPIVSSLHDIEHHVKEI